MRERLARVRLASKCAHFAPLWLEELRFALLCLLLLQALLRSPPLSFRALRHGAPLERLARLSLYRAAHYCANLPLNSAYSGQKRKWHYLEELTCPPNETGDGNKESFVHFHETFFPPNQFKPKIAAPPLFLKWGKSSIWV